MSARGDSAPSWRPSSPSRLEEDLAALWRDAAKGGPVSRAIMSNLIVVFECGRSLRSVTGSVAAPLIVDVVRRHPSRAVLLNRASDVTGPGTPKEATVAVVTFGERVARYGVELVAVDAECTDASVPSILRGVTVGDLPTTVWWTGDISRGDSNAAMRSIAAMGRQLVYDSAEWTDFERGVRTVLSVLTASRCADVADLNWRRLATFRHAIVHACETGPAPRHLDAAGVRVRHLPSVRSKACLTLAWLQTRFRWKNAPAMPEADPGLGADLVVELSGPEWRVAVSAAGPLITATDRDKSNLFSLTQPQEAQADAIAAELVILARDGALQETMRAIAGWSDN